MSEELTTAEMLERFLLLANVFHKEYGIRNDEDVVEVEKGKYISKYDYQVYLKIEAALKRLDNYEQNEDFTKDVLNYAHLSEQDKIKQLKALEIIKSKNVVVTLLKKDSLYEYNGFAFKMVKICQEYPEKLSSCPQQITQEEYEILKEVFKL